VHLGTETNCLDFEVKSSKVKVIHETKCGQIITRSKMHLFVEGVLVDGSPSKPMYNPSK